MYVKKFLAILCLILSFNLNFAQPNNLLQLLSQFKPYPPLKKIAVVSSFGELRLNHLHSGIDLSGFHKIGTPVHAIDSGYVSKILVSSTGYGKAVYITHSNGLTSVYAHLDHFAKPIQQLVTQKQLLLHQNQITIYPSPNSIKIKKGQIIGYLGSTGWSYAPHLHFEIRDAYLNFPINPLLAFNFYDKTPPVISEIGIYPASDSSVILGKHSTHFFFTRYLHKPICIFGPVYFSVKTFDPVPQHYDKKGIYELKLFADSKLVFQYTFDMFFFQNTRYANAILDYKQYYFHRKKFYKLYKPANFKLHVCKIAINNGVISFKKGLHKITIIASDINHNSTKFSFYIKICKPQKITKLQINDSILQPMKSYTFSDQNFKILLPPLTLYDTTKPFLKLSPNPYGPDSIITFLHPYIPINQPITIWFRIPDSVPTKHLTIAYKNHNHFSSLKSYISDNYIKAQALNLGSYLLIYDTLPPYIRPLFRYFTTYFNKSLKFKIYDNLGNISSINVFVNNHWTPAYYKALTNTLYITVSHKFFSPGKNTLTITASDPNGNTQTKTFTIFVNP